MAESLERATVPNPSTTPRVRLIDRIVIPVAGTDSEFLAQRWALSLAELLGVRVRAVHVVEPGRDPPRDVFAFLEAEAKKRSVDLRTGVTYGNDPADEIVKEAGGLDLIVVGTKRLANGYHVGSVAGQLLKRAPCPVQMVRLV